MYHWILTLQAQGSTLMTTEAGTTDITNPQNRFMRILEEVRKTNPGFEQSVVIFYVVEEM